MPSKQFLKIFFLCVASASAFSSLPQTNKHVKRHPTTLNNFFNRGSGGAGPASNLPKPDPSNAERFISSTSTSADFYPIYITLLRNGPVPTFKRLTSSDEYEQIVYKYQYEQKEADLEEAQANMDAFISSPQTYVENKLRESKGEREVTRYATPLSQERVVLSLTWAGIVFFIVGKIIWKGVLHF